MRFGLQGLEMWYCKDVLTSCHLPEKSGWPTSQARQAEFFFREMAKTPKGSSLGLVLEAYKSKYLVGREYQCRKAQLQDMPRHSLPDPLEQPSKVQYSISKSISKSISPVPASQVSWNILHIPWGALLDALKFSSGYNLSTPIFRASAMVSGDLFVEILHPLFFSPSPFWNGTFKTKHAWKADGRDSEYRCKGVHCANWDATIFLSPFNPYQSLRLCLYSYSVIRLAGGNPNCNRPLCIKYKPCCPYLERYTAVYQQMSTWSWLLGVKGQSLQSW